ncbi:hypothetical protein HDU82_004180 [Entophlyctis luteolus]|nr:hypothetical protein HDU82_004180 [Entophlyctis luteolus]
MDALIDTVRDNAKAAFSNFRPAVPADNDGSLHISLSRTVFLKEFQIPRFIALMKSKISLNECPNSMT